jgi:3',5'-cyclic-AMP phosphodiesterase
VFFHHSGHTHRNKRTYLLDDSQSPVESVEFLEVGATKEYPGGHSLVRLYTGGSPTGTTPWSGTCRA